MSLHFHSEITSILPHFISFEIWVNLISTNYKDVYTHVITLYKMVSICKVILHYKVSHIPIRKSLVTGSVTTSGTSVDISNLQLHWSILSYDTLLWMVCFLMPNTPKSWSAKAGHSLWTSKLSPRLMQGSHKLQ